MLKEEYTSTHILNIVKLLKEGTQILNIVKFFKKFHTNIKYLVIKSNFTKNNIIK